jgi:hypothetical protein
MQMTAAWKRRVLERLEANRRIDRSPRNVAELARAVGADKGGISRALQTDQPSSKYVPEICRVLGLDMPMIENSVDDAEWDRDIAYLRSLTRKQREVALAIVREVAKLLDS